MGKNADTKRILRFQLQESLSMHRIRMIACNDYTTLCLLESQTVLQMAGAHDHEPKLIPALAGL